MNKKEMFETLTRDVVSDSLKKTYNLANLSDKQLEFVHEISERLYTIFESSVKVKEMEQWLMVPAFPDMGNR